MDVVSRIDGEPGPARDCMKAFVTNKKDNQFFFNTEYLKQYAASKSKVTKMLNCSTLAKQRVPVLSKYIEKHNLLAVKTKRNHRKSKLLWIIYTHQPREGTNKPAFK